jgi:hypothetical protein
MELPQDLEDLASRAEYVGSVEHKNRKSWLGLPKPRRSKNPPEEATICPLVGQKDREIATKWVKYAICNRQFDPNDLQNGFPRHIWHRNAEGEYWQGKLTQSGAGDAPRAEYKGWPISEEEKRENFT